MANRILLIGSDPAIREALHDDLTAAGFTVEQAGLDEVRPMPPSRTPPQASVIDLTSPRLDDLHKIRSVLLRREASSLPMLGVLRPNGLTTLSTSLRVDDFVLLPYNRIELVARLALLLERHAERTSRRYLEAGPLLVDTAQYTVQIENQRVALTLKEFELLAFLVENRGKVFSRSVLVNKVWGYEYEGETRTVDVHIRRLRDKLGDTDQALIQTVRGVGYRFAADS